MLAAEIAEVHATSIGSTAPSCVGVRGSERRRCPTVVNAAERHGFHVTDLSVAEPTLETVFINLTGKDLRE